MGRALSEDKIYEEIQAFLSELYKNEGQPFDFSDSIHLAVSDVISALVFGHRYEDDDSEFLSLLAAMKVSALTCDSFAGT